MYTATRNTQKPIYGTQPLALDLRPLALTFERNRDYFRYRDPLLTLDFTLTMTVHVTLDLNYERECDLYLNYERECDL